MAGEEVGDGAVPGEEGLPSSWLPSPEITRTKEKSPVKPLDFKHDPI